MGDAVFNATCLWGSSFITSCVSYQLDYENRLREQCSGFYFGAAAVSARSLISEKVGMHAVVEGC